MADDLLRPDVVALLGRQVCSIEELEVLMHLYQARGSRDAIAVASALRLTEAATVTTLQGLVLARLVEQTGDSSPLLYVLAPAVDLRAAWTGSPAHMTRIASS